MTIPEIVQKVDFKDGCIGFLRMDGSLKSKLSKEDSIIRYNEEIDFLYKNYKGYDLPGCQEYYEERMKIIKSQLKKLTGDS